VLVRACKSWIKIQNATPRSYELFSICNINLRLRRFQALRCTNPDTEPTSQVQRALTALTITSPDKVPAALDAFFQAFWVDGDSAKVEKGEAMVKCFSGVLGEEEAKKVVEMVSLINQRFYEPWSRVRRCCFFCSRRGQNAEPGFEEQ